MKNIFLIGMLLFVYNIHAQVLYHETFDTYPLGRITTDATGNAPGLGGWFVRSHNYNMGFNPNNVYDITPEAGRGNVFITGSLNASSFYNDSGVVFYRNDIDSLWQNRTIGNNIMLVEYDVWMTPNAQSKSLRFHFSINGDNCAYTIDSRFKDHETSQMPASSFLMYFLYRQLGTPPVVTVPLGYNGTREFKNFPYGKWFTVKLYIENLYQNTIKTGVKVYLFIPDLFILKFSGKSCIG